ncbi:hypothetical protein D3C87_978780 [compost metagenome]
MAGLSHWGTRGVSKSPSSGKSRKVLAITTRWSRQWPRPASRFWRDSLAPCMKKSSATASLVSSANQTATWPSQGKKEARATTRISTEVKGSRRTGSLQGKRVPHRMGDDRAQEGHPLTATLDTKPQLTPNTGRRKVERRPKHSVKLNELVFSALKLNTQGGQGRPERQKNGWPEATRAAPQPAFRSAGPGCRPPPCPRRPACGPDASRSGRSTSRPAPRRRPS